MSRTVYLPHGGGPLPLLEKKVYENMNNFIINIGQEYVPETIIVFSAHLETDEVNVIYNHNNDLVFDYYGFPEETYKYSYNPPINKSLGENIIKELKKSGINAVESIRGFDHGVFVPLLLMYPKADIPVIQISLKNGLDPEYHIKLGEALRYLKNQNILFIGSGFSFHNMREFFSKGTDTKNEYFHEWLIDVISKDITEEERKLKLINWKEAPNSTYAHPRSEHLIPLHICYGINGTKGTIGFNEEVLNKRTIGVLW